MTFEPDRALAREHKFCWLLRKVLDSFERRGTLDEQGPKSIRRARQCIKSRDDVTARQMLTGLAHRFERGLEAGHTPYPGAKMLYEEIKTALGADE